MPIFSRNINNNNRLPDQDIDTVVERLLKHIILTGTVESELANASVRSYYTSTNLNISVSDNSSSPPDLIIFYKFNNLLSLESRYATSGVPSWTVVYDILFKLRSAVNTTDSDMQKIKKIVELVEQYQTNNILSEVLNDYEYRTDVNNIVYGTNLNSNVRIDNPLDNIFFQDNDSTNYIQTAISIKYKINQYNSL